MLPTKFRFIWPCDFRGEDLKKSANQKQELPVAVMFVNGSGCLWIYKTFFSQKISTIYILSSKLLLAHLDHRCGIVITLGLSYMSSSSSAHFLYFNPSMNQLKPNMAEMLFHFWLAEIEKSFQTPYVWWNSYMVEMFLIWHYGHFCFGNPKWHPLELRM
jgi:hypothetical protein